jgi:hypothetical protein
VVGFQFGSTVPSANTCARFVLGCVSTAVKTPPRYQPPLPSGATALTKPSTTGHVVSASVLPALKRAVVPVYGARLEKLPPIHAVLPEVTIASTSPSGIHVDAGAPGTTAPAAGAPARAARAATLAARRRHLMSPACHLGRVRAMSVCRV